MFQMNALIEPALYLSVVLALLCKKPAAKVLLVVATVWMHEMAVLTCVPLYCALEWICYGKRKTAVMAFVLGVFSFIMIMTYLATVDEGVIAAYGETLFQYTGKKPGNMTVFEHSLSSSRSTWKTHYMNHTWWSRCKDAMIFVLLMASVLSAGFYKKRRDKFDTLVIFLAALSPLALGFGGWDINRWIFLALLNTSVLWVVFIRDMDMMINRFFLLTSIACFLFSSVYPLDNPKFAYRNFNETMQAATHINDYILGHRTVPRFDCGKP